MTALKQLAWSFVILFYLCLNTEFQVVVSSGRLFIKLKSYEDFHGWNMNGSCCDGPNPSGGGCKPCDHFIVACLKDNRDKGRGACISNTVTSNTVQDSNNITFGSSVGNETNPFILNFTIPTRNLELAFNYFDDDRVDNQPGAKETELLENTTYVVYTLIPDLYTPNPVLTNGSIPTNNSRLSFDYNLQCDEHYYDKCDRYCMPDTVRYTCSSRGRPVCNPGWSDKNCTTFDFCSNTTCQNGASCQSTKSDFKCNCVGNYTGKLCESRGTGALSSTTTTDSNFQTTKTPQAIQGKDEPASNSNGPMIAGVVVGILVVLGAAASGVLYYMKRKKSKVNHLDVDENGENVQQDDKTDTKSTDQDQQTTEKDETKHQEDTDKKGTGDEARDTTAVDKTDETNTKINSE